MTDARIAAFLQRLTEIDRGAPLSDAKIESLHHDERMLVIEESDEIVAVGVTASHQQPDGTLHWAVETALDPGLRFDAFEERLLSSAIALAPIRESVSVWSHRTSLDSALAASGFTCVRELAQFTVALPLHDAKDTLKTRMFRESDASQVLGVNRSAFAAHREAAGLDEPELGRLMAKKGMGSDGFLLAHEGEETLGFCWTKVHSTGVGEIFRIAVSPDAQGRGLGRSLVLAGFDHLAAHVGLSKGMLWVDLSNKRAVALYESIGMSQAFVNREYERIGDSD